MRADFAQMRSRKHVPRACKFNEQGLASETFVDTRGSALGSPTARGRCSFARVFTRRRMFVSRQCLPPLLFRIATMMRRLRCQWRPPPHVYQDLMCDIAGPVVLPAGHAIQDSMHAGPNLEKENSLT